MLNHRKMTRCFMNGKGCIYERVIDERIEKMKAGTGEKKAFVIMPFAPHLNAIYRWQISPFIERGGGSPSVPGETEYMCKTERADDVRQIGYIICEKICKKIQEANLVVVDLSYDNPNVFYELGIALALRKPILPICLDQKRADREDMLRRILGVGQVLSCPSFDILSGKISENLFKNTAYESFDQLRGNRILVLHDGRNIDVTATEKAPLKYNFAKLCLSATGNAVQRIFDADNMKEFPELQKYSEGEIRQFKDMGHVNLANERYETVIGKVQDSYCVIVDTSSASPAPYFWLGYIHAIGGFAIPINVVDSKGENGMPAFDIRALWHIYFDKESPSNLADSLRDILEFAFVEKSKFLQRSVFWRDILKDNKVSIFLGSRMIPELGRNTIGDWDYRTAAELTSYLSKAKETMEVTLESPIQKNESTPQGEHITNLKRQLENKNCIIVASSDVNDLTEVALAELWNVKPFVEVNDQDAGFNGFIAYKSYQKTAFPIQSAFFRCVVVKDQPTRGFVLRRGQKSTEALIVEPHHDPQSSNKDIIHNLLGQVIVAKNPFPDQTSNKWLIIISGISGPATLGIAQMLTGCFYQEFTVNKLKAESTDEFGNLDELLKKNSAGEMAQIAEFVSRDTVSYDRMSEDSIKKLNETMKEAVICSALVTVAVYYPKVKRFHDERKVIGWTFVDIQKKCGADFGNPYAFKYNELKRLR